MGAEEIFTIVGEVIPFIGVIYFILYFAGVLKPTLKTEAERKTYQELMQNKSKYFVASGIFVLLILLARIVFVFIL